MLMSSSSTANDEKHKNSNQCTPLISMQRNAAYYSRINAQTLNKKGALEHVTKVLKNSLVDIEDIERSVITCSDKHIDTKLLTRDVVAVRKVMQRASAALNMTLDQSLKLSSQTKTIMLRGVVYSIMTRTLLKINAVHHTLLFKGNMPYDNHYTTAKVANVTLSLSHAADILHRIPHNRNLVPTAENANLFDAATMSAQTVYESLYSLQKVVKKDTYDRIVCCYTLIAFTLRLLSEYSPVDALESFRLCSSITMNSAGILAHKIADEDLLAPRFIPIANSLRKIIISSVCVHIDIMEGCAKCKELRPSLSYYSCNNQIDTRDIIEKVAPEARQIKNLLFSKLCSNALHISSVTNKSDNLRTYSDAVLQRYDQSLREKTIAESATSSGNLQRTDPSSTLSSPSSSRSVSHFTKCT